MANRRAVFTSSTHKLILGWSGKRVRVQRSASRPKKERGRRYCRGSRRAPSSRVAFRHLRRGLVTPEVDSCHIDCIFFLFFFFFNEADSGSAQIIATVSWGQTKHLSEIISCWSTERRLGRWHSARTVTLCFSILCSLRCARLRHTSRFNGFCVTVF